MPKPVLKLPDIPSRSKAGWDRALKDDLIAINDYVGEVGTDLTNFKTTVGTGSGSTAPTTIDGGSATTVVYTNIDGGTASS